MKHFTRDKTLYCPLCGKERVYHVTNNNFAEATHFCGNCGETFLFNDSGLFEPQAQHEYEKFIARKEQKEEVK